MPNAGMARGRKTDPPPFFNLIYNPSSCIYGLKCHQCTHFLQRTNCINFAVLLPQLHHLSYGCSGKEKATVFARHEFFYAAPESSNKEWMIVCVIIYVPKYYDMMHVLVPLILRNVYCWVSNEDKTTYVLKLRWF